MGKDKQRSAKADKPKKKKEKIIYIDDGSTVADMSGTRGRPARPPRPQAAPTGKRGRKAPTTRAGQIRQTYFDAVRAMIGPMLVFIGGMSIAFFLIWLILGFFA